MQCFMQIKTLFSCAKAHDGVSELNIKELKKYLSRFFNNTLFIVCCV